MRFTFPLPFASAMKLPDRVAFSFSGFDVYWSGILLSAGIILTIFLAQAESKRKKLPQDTAVDLCLIGIPLGVIFARLGYVFLNFKYYSANPLNILHFWDGGLSVYGAIIGVLLGIVIYSLAKKLRFFALTDLLLPGLLVTQAFALWGNFFEQTGYGAEITNPGLQWFPFAVLIENPDTICAAVFFYEFIWCALVFTALWFFARKRARRDGAVTLWYLLLYPIGHIGFEFLRSGGDYLFGSVRLSQVVCAVLALFALIMLILRAKKPVPAEAAAEECAEATEGEPEAVPESKAETGSEQQTESADEPSAEQKAETPAAPADEKPDADDESNKEA